MEPAFTREQAGGKMTVHNTKQAEAMAQIVSLNEYQLIARQTDQNKQKGLDGLPFFLLGLFGEVGTLLSALKKKQRDQESYVGYDDSIIEEFGGALRGLREARWHFRPVMQCSSRKRRLRRGRSSSYGVVEYRADHRDADKYARQNNRAVPEAD